MITNKIVLYCKETKDTLHKRKVHRKCYKEEQQTCPRVSSRIWSCLSDLCAFGILLLAPFMPCFEVGKKFPLPTHIHLCTWNPESVAIERQLLNREQRLHYSSVNIGHWSLTFLAISSTHNCFNQPPPPCPPNSTALWSSTIFKVKPEQGGGLLPITAGEDHFSMTK